MSPKPSPAFRLARLLGLACIPTAALAAVALLVLPQPKQSMQTAISSLDRLRTDATLGNTDASRYLTLHLLKRYDTNQDESALFEAAMWFDHDWNTQEYFESNVATRLAERGCGHAVLKWHWLCALGE